MPARRLSQQDGEWIDRNRAFDFSFELQGVDLIPRIDLTSLLNFKVEIPESAPKWITDAADWIKQAMQNIELSISLTGITGSIDIPGLTLNIGDFVYLQGDFKLTLGDTFKADAYTGIDPMLGGALNSLFDLATEQLIGAVTGPELAGLVARDADIVQRLLGFNSDFTVLKDVSYTGTSFGASNVNLFVGGGGKPDFTRPLASQDGLVGFGMQNLDLAIGVYTPKLPGFLDTLFGKSVQKVISMKATADELGTHLRPSEATKDGEARALHLLADSEEGGQEDEQHLVVCRCDDEPARAGEEERADDVLDDACV
jgi:hypothetical protein